MRQCVGVLGLRADADADMAAEIGMDTGMEIGKDMAAAAWLAAVILVLVFIIIGLLIKIALMKKAAEEIAEAFSDRIGTDTNTLIDISSRDRSMRRLADNINAQLREFRAQRRRFRQGDMELKDAIANISHDLRTPLTAICGYLDLLEGREQTEEMERYLKIIRSRTETLKQLMEELFKYTVFNSAAEEMAYGEVVVNSVLEESIAAYYAVLTNAHIMPEIVMPEERVTRTLNGDALSRIFGNIISNAVKYSSGDLKIVLSPEGRITFSNHAAGLDAVQAGRLFDRFYTVEAARKSTGLGLSIAKMLTEEMGGSISAQYDGTALSVVVEFPGGKLCPK